MTRLISILATLWVLMVTSGPVEAMSLTFRFKGTVNQVAPELAGAFSVGQGIFGSYSFDSAETDSQSNEPNVGLYAYDSFRFRIGDYAGAADDPGGHGIGVFNDIGPPPSHDIYRVQNNRGIPQPILADPVAGYIPVEVSFQLTDLTGTALDSDALPLIPPDLSDFGYVRGFRLSFVEPGNVGGGPFFAVLGKVISVSSIPEPATVVLMGLGLAGLGYMGRRKLAR